MDRPFPIVGVGASAGGVEALEYLFKAMPSEPGMAFVIVTHLARKRESMLPEILARDTRMPVLIAENDQLVRPNHVYVVPADAVLDISKGRLGVRGVGDGRERTPIDSFFAALAEDQGEYDRRAQIQQRGDGLRQRGAAVHQRGTGDVEGRAAVGQRGELQTVNHELTVKIDEL